MIGELDVKVELAGGIRDDASPEGAIVGQALYAGRFTLPEAFEAVRRIDEMQGTSGAH